MSCRKLLFSHASLDTAGLPANQPNPYQGIKVEYADCDAYGYYRVSILDNVLQTEFVVLPEPIENALISEPAVRRRVHFEVPAWQSLKEPQPKLSAISGEPPLLGLKPG